MKSSKKSHYIRLTVTGIAIFFFIEYHFFQNAKKNGINILSNKYQMYSQISNFNNKRITGDENKQGYLVYVPYIELDEGDYKINFRLRLNNIEKDSPSNKKVCICDVNIVNNISYNRAKEIEVDDFHGSNWKAVNLDFQVPSGKHQCEFRIFQFSGNNLTLQKLYLEIKDFKKSIKFIIKNFINYSIALYLILLLFGGTLYILIKEKQWKTKMMITPESLQNNAKFDSRSIPVSFFFQGLLVAFFAILAFNAFLFDMVKIPIVLLTELVAIFIFLVLFSYIKFKFGLKFPKIDINFWDIMLFLFVFGFIGYALLKPALPSLMPINFSNDCVYHYVGIDYIYNHHIIAGSPAKNYPFGYHVTVALLAHFTGIPPIKMSHILLVFIVALNTAFVYALINRVFRLEKDGKLIAILSVFALFWVRGYYELSFNSFFHAPMIFSYLFMISFLWALVEYWNGSSWFIYAILIMSCIGMIFAYTSYLPMLLIPFAVVALFKNRLKFGAIVRDILILFVPIVILALIFLKMSGRTGLGLKVLYHEGYGIAFNFLNFGDFSNNYTGGIFLVLSLFGISLFISSKQANFAILSFTGVVLLNFFILYVLKHYFGIFSYYQAYKILYFTPYVAVIYITSIIYTVRQQFHDKYKAFMGERILHVVGGSLLIIFIMQFSFHIYELENYKPNYVEMLKEPVYLNIDWARKNIKTKIDYIYHHPNIGNWMRQGFMGEVSDDKFYNEVFNTPVPTLAQWLKTAHQGDVAIVDNMNDPLLTEEKQKQIEILFKRDYSAVIRKK